jgi:hypothetical protein
MPGERYTMDELAKMTPSEFATAQANNFERGSVADAYRDVENGHPHPALQTNIPSPSMPADRYAVTTWGQNGQDFRTPSGQLCRLRKLNPAKLAASGILDRITRLPGMAQDLVDQAEGAPPAKTDEMPSAEAVEALVDLLNVLIPIAVEQPTIYPLPGEGEERVTGRVYVDSVDFTDQVAIMEKVVGGLRSFDNFRQ